MSVKSSAAEHQESQMGHTEEGMARQRKVKAEKWEKVINTHHLFLLRIRIANIQMKS